MKERHRVTPAVFATVLKEHEVLLLRRANTGWMDGFYDMPAGHQEFGELPPQAMARELLEETGINVKPEDLNLYHIYINDHNPNSTYEGKVFLAKKWIGQPQILEPGKCDDVNFFPLDNLPTRITPYTIAALGNLSAKKVTFSYFAPGSMPK